MWVEPGTAILVGAGVALFGWLVNARTTLITDRRMHTYQVRKDYRGNDRFLNALERARKVVVANDIPSRNDPARTDDIKAIRIVLDQFEFLAASIFNGDIDEAFMKDCEYTLLSTAPSFFRDFIDDQRLLGPQPTYLRGLEDLARRWTIKPPGRLQKKAEWVRMRPYRKTPQWVRMLTGQGLLGSCE